MGAYVLKLIDYYSPYSTFDLRFILHVFLTCFKYFYFSPCYHNTVCVVSSFISALLLIHTWMCFSCTFTWRTLLNNVIVLMTNSRSHALDKLFPLRFDQDDIQEAWRREKKDRHFRVEKKERKKERSNEEQGDRVLLMHSCNSSFLFLHVIYFFSLPPSSSTCFPPNKLESYHSLPSVQVYIGNILFISKFFLLQRSSFKVTRTNGHVLLSFKVSHVIH